MSHRLLVTFYESQMRKKDIENWFEVTGDMSRHKSLTGDITDGPCFLKPNHRWLREKKGDKWNLTKISSKTWPVSIIWKNPAADSVKISKQIKFLRIFFQILFTRYKLRPCNIWKVVQEGWVFPKSVWSDSRKEQYTREDDHREEAPHFTTFQI